MITNIDFFKGIEIAQLTFVLLIIAFLLAFHISRDMDKETRSSRKNRD